MPDHPRYSHKKELSSFDSYSTPLEVRAALLKAEKLNGGTLDGVDFSIHDENAVFSILEPETDTQYEKRIRAYERQEREKYEELKRKFGP